ncbi:hypothetical protein TraAM80_04893 [Trypanosoma rangeli]|uniref:Uncharacterized protein n=1 Tax=Trypanosoma rangeli TaxID=5698 RepID=A0A422NH19_TRYRA|nr:uncharacterized protein TraAM80_04893 [Trypanosoma rangeli]RNF04751.1 hypothetical protein TraAM80_04893 [Trypanosoma rangeli]|eukprot:RNF04751.1 hypothetical protein TraAM80_04893 [Trypanosoma rangeli]
MDLISGQNLTCVLCLPATHGAGEWFTASIYVFLLEAYFWLSAMQSGLCYLLVMPPEARRRSGYCARLELKVPERAQAVVGWRLWKETLGKTNCFLAWVCVNRGVWCRSRFPNARG